MKKLMILIICLILLLAPLAWEQEKVEAPIINVGSTWNYKADTGLEWTSTLIGEEKDFYIFSTTWEGVEWKRYFDKKNWHCVKVLRNGKEDKESKDERNRLSKVFDFPFYPGKKWTYLNRFVVPFNMIKTYGVPLSRQTIDLFNKVSVLGFEDVNVAAGKFRAIKIQTEQYCLTEGCHCKERSYRKIYYWYSPDTKDVLKFERDPRRLNSFTVPYEKYELTSFELK